jgi:hypothetical protein
MMDRKRFFRIFAGFFGCAHYIMSVI